jgi:DnaJ-class molecular chaperone
VGDMSPCRHHDFQGYCMKCNELCPRCAGSGEIKAMTQGSGPDDYEIDVECPRCKGIGLIARADPTVGAKP